MERLNLSMLTPKGPDYECTNTALLNDVPDYKLRARSYSANWQLLFFIIFFTLTTLTADFLLSWYTTTVCAPQKYSFLSFLATYRFTIPQKYNSLSTLDFKNFLQQLYTSLVAMHHRLYDIVYNSRYIVYRTLLQLKNNFIK